MVVVIFCMKITTTTTNERTNKQMKQTKFISLIVKIFLVSFQSVKKINKNDNDDWAYKLHVIKFNNKHKLQQT